MGIWRFSDVIVGEVQTYCCVEFTVNVLKVKIKKKDLDTLQWEEEDEDREQEPTHKVHL